MVCFSKPDTFLFLFGCVSAFSCVFAFGANRENRFNSWFDILGTVASVLTVFFSFGTRSMEDSSSDS